MSERGGEGVVRGHMAIYICEVKGRVQGWQGGYLPGGKTSGVYRGKKGKQDMIFPPFSSIGFSPLWVKTYSIFKP